MVITKKEFSSLIKEFKLRELFNSLGWNNDKTTQPIVIDNYAYQLQSIAEKSGFRILVCSPNTQGKIPDYVTRKKIDTAVTKLFHEHLLIFSNGKKDEQIWQYIIKRQGKPAKVNEIRYSTNQTPELLFQKTSGLFFTLEDEESITIVDVNEKFNKNFNINTEKVTKKFYDGFKKIHSEFVNFIEGINERIYRDWYASLMLNRLMFCYFIQKKGFLDNNKNYLRDKLLDCQKKIGENKFYSFYRSFLLELFHQGLGGVTRTPEFISKIGKIPYLNGGLFDIHEIEQSYSDIDISDKAFEKIFDFFDQYEWHLDTSKDATGKDINPDVIGYIFEKYINDRAQMGAYYTQEDITEYISKSCILPYIFNETEQKYPEAFSPNSFIWQLVKNSGDKYILESLKYGVDIDLPENIQVGVDTEASGLLERRKDWNKIATSDLGLNSETWREVYERRTRYIQIRQKIDNGDIKSIRDFIEYNLDIRQFAQDIIESIDNANFIWLFYKTMNDMTIIDPTCGSGAFLFAALNILEPLYESCIMRMRYYLDESGNPRRYKNFEKVIDEIDQEIHPSQEYYIYKSIILRNLYGVDMMKEAVETAKLRLFLKLVAAVEADYTKENLGLEPLPDIDFNIKAGNTLVGYANERELDDALNSRLDGMLLKGDIKEKCLMLERANNKYKAGQLEYGYNFKELKEAKKDLNIRQKELNNMLNKLYTGYGAKNLDKWLKVHQPFHWYAEFYDIITVNGGFNVIIGNPPYVEFKDVEYSVPTSYISFDSKAIHAICIERSLNILNSNGSCGMIVPISICASDGFNSIRKYMDTKMKTMYFSHYSMRPSKLFDEVEKHLTIFILHSFGEKTIFSSKYHRWYSVEREHLFSKISYTKINNEVFHNNSIPKIGTNIEVEILKKIKKHNGISLSTVTTSDNKIFHTRKLRYFLQFLNQAPKIYEEDGSLRVTSELKEICFPSEQDKYIGLAVYLSSLFFWYYITYSDCRNLNKREVATFPFTFSNLTQSQKDELENLGRKLMINLQDNSYYCEANYKKYGKLKMQVFRPRLSKEIVDLIDVALAKSYGFTSEELEFLLNYDIKFRMGSDDDEE